LFAECEESLSKCNRCRKAGDFSENFQKHQRYLIKARAIFEAFTLNAAALTPDAAAPAVGEFVEQLRRFDKRFTRCCGDGIDGLVGDINTKYKALMAFRIDNGVDGAWEHVLTTLSLLQKSQAFLATGAADGVDDDVSFPEALAFVCAAVRKEEARAATLAESNKFEKMGVILWNLKCLSSKAAQFVELHEQCTSTLKVAHEHVSRRIQQLKSLAIAKYKLAHTTGCLPEERTAHAAAVQGALGLLDDAQKHLGGQYCVSRQFAGIMEGNPDSGGVMGGVIGDIAAYTLVVFDNAIRLASTQQIQPVCDIILSLYCISFGIQHSSIASDVTATITRILDACNSKAGSKKSAPGIIGGLAALLNDECNAPYGREIHPRKVPQAVQEIHACPVG
jgi:hypothetical protein